MLSHTGLRLDRDNTVKLMRDRLLSYPTPIRNLEGGDFFPAKHTAICPTPYGGRATASLPSKSVSASSYAEQSNGRGRRPPSW